MQITSVRYRKLVSLRGCERKALEAENQVERDAVPRAPRFAIEQTTCPPKAKVTRSNRVGCAIKSNARLALAAARRVAAKRERTAPRRKSKPHP